MKKENKKKVVTLSAMAALLAVVLGMGGKTYAKYITNASADAQTATVAKFGLVLNTQADNLWGASYKSNSTDGSTSATVNGADEVVVKGTSSVVAPGTKGSVTFNLTGVSEVKAELSFEINVAKEIHLDSYYPMVWSNGTDSGKLTEVTPDPITIDAGDSINETITLSWDWAFTGHDTEDTILGQYAYGTALPSPYTSAEKTVEFSLTATLTQLAA